MKSIIKCIAVIFITIGIVLSMINFLSFRSLWLDEAMLALNIVNKSAYELLYPLDYNQVVPIGFLLIEKLFSYLLGNTDWSMRIFPLISFLISILLLYSTTHKVLKSKLFALYTSAFFATSLLMISYSSEAKQYMSDVAVGLAIILATIIYNENNIKNKWRLYALIGTISIWFSNISVLLLFSSGLYSIYKTHNSINKNYRCLAAILGLWLFSFLIYYTLFIHNHPTKDIMVNYWQNAEGFIHQDILSIEFYKSLYFKIRSFFDLLGSRMFALALAPIFLIGIFFLCKKKMDYLYLLVFPLLLHLILSYFHLYPFYKRLILYLFPALSIIIFSGLFFMYSILEKNKQQWLYVLPLFLMANIFILFHSGFPIKKEEIKKSMSYINSKFVEHDNIYVYYSAQPAFNFYKDDLIEKIDESNVVKALGNRNNWSDYQIPILKMNGSAWILFSHVYRVKNEDDLNEEEYILNIFRNNGFQIIDEQKHKGSSVYHAIKAEPMPIGIYAK